MSTQIYLYFGPQWSSVVVRSFNFISHFMIILPIIPSFYFKICNSYSCFLIRRFLLLRISKNFTFRNNRENSIDSDLILVSHYK